MKHLSRALAGLALVYVFLFLTRQLDAVGDAHALEWDARNMLLPAWRYHGTGLFPNDLTVDLMARFATPAWKAIYWLGTLVTTPLFVSQLLPFIGLGIVAWQGWKIGEREGGAALGAITVVLLVHCTMIWNRMAGGHARFFAYPLVVALLRYTLEGRVRAALTVIVLEALCYPSVLLFCLPAYALTIVRDRKQWRAFTAVAIVALAIAALQSRPDPRFGGAPSLTQAASIRQMGPGGPQPFYPLPSIGSDVRGAASYALRDDGDLWHGPIATWNDTHHCVLTIGLVAIIVLLGLRRMPILLPAFFASTCAIYVVTRLLAYRLYLPDRVLVFGWPPLVLVALPILLHRTLKPRLGERAPLVTALALGTFVFAVCGDGLPENENITDFGLHDTNAVQYLATRPKDIVVATHPERAAFVQTFAHRNVLFSAPTNIPWFVDYEREMERRIEAFYRAYYTDDPAVLDAFAREYHVDYLIADERDFGPEAQKRARYYAPWGALAKSLIEETQTFALERSDRVVFHDGPRFIVDLRAR